MFVLRAKSLRAWNARTEAPLPPRTIPHYAPRYPRATVTDERDVPTGRLGRLAKLVGVGARTGAGLLFSSDGRRAAEHAAEVLGSLRGLAAKVGQMASYVDGFVPEAQRDAYSKALGSLLAAAPRSSWASIQKVIEAELGASVEASFAEF